MKKVVKIMPKKKVITFSHLQKKAADFLSSHKTGICPIGDYRWIQSFPNLKIRLTSLKFQSIRSNYKRMFTLGGPGDHLHWRKVLTYLSLLDSHSSDPDFFDKLVKSTPSTKVMQAALNKIRDSQWQRTWRSHTTNPISLEIPSEPSSLRVLDPFAGSGSIPIEALRFGCETYAGDLNPVSSLILRSVLQFPQEYFSANPHIKGTGPNEIWNGLDKELHYWAKWVEQKVLSATQSLFSYSNMNSGEFSPIYYLWAKSYKCCNPSCPVDYYPFPTSFVLDQLRNTKRYVEYNFDNGQFSAIVKTGSKPSDDKRKITCPVCGNLLDKDTQRDQNITPGFIFGCSNPIVLQN